MSTLSASPTTAVAQSKKHWPNLRNSTVCRSKKCRKLMLKTISELPCQHIFFLPGENIHKGIEFLTRPARHIVPVLKVGFDVS